MNSALDDKQLHSDIHRFICETFLMDPQAKLAGDLSLLTEGIVDSTGVLELVAFLEESYDFEVEDHEIVPQNFDSIDSLCRYVQSRVSS